MASVLKIITLSLSLEKFLEELIKKYEMKIAMTIGSKCSSEPTVTLCIDKKANCIKQYSQIDLHTLLSS